MDTEFASPAGISQTRTFANTFQGHRHLITWATKRKGAVRACLEATGAYSWEIALALYEHPQCQAMMTNPRATKHFAHALMQRTKTDRVDTDCLLQFLARMPFVAWAATDPGGTGLTGDYAPHHAIERHDGPREEPAPRR